MKIEISPKKISAILVLAFLTAGLVSDVSAQDTRRPRVIISNPVVRVQPSPTPAVTTSIPATTKSTAYLKSRLNGILINRLLMRGRVGVKVMSLRTGKTIYERNADKYFMPASNMKSYSVAAAIDQLSPNFRFVTSVYANAKPDSSGTVRGNLIIYGRGDPSISTNFNDGDYYKGIDALADKIAQAGVKRIDGSLIGDETYFNSKAIPFGWEWDDLQWYYGAEVSSLSVNNNSVDLKISPSSVGSPASVSILPANRQFRIINKTQTVRRGIKRELKVTKRLGENVLEITGKIPENDSGYAGYIAVSRPANLFVEILKQRLQQRGITVRGASQAINTEDRGGMRLQTEGLVEITNMQSVPLRLIAEKTMKPSQNLYTELILRALGEERGDKTDPEKTSLQKGVEVVQNVLRKAGVAPDSVVQYDASGLSRHNLITPDSAVKLYQYMNRSPHAFAWRNSLTIGGVDGTLKRRFLGTSAASNVRGKTGTIDQVSALTGYVTSKSGEQFVFSVLTNNLPDSRLRVRTIDEVVLLLSDFDGRTD